MPPEREHGADEADIEEVVKGLNALRDALNEVSLCLKDIQAARDLATQGQASAQSVALLQSLSPFFAAMQHDKGKQV